MENEVSCINTGAVLHYAREHHHGDISGLIVNLDPEIDALPDPERFLMDPNNWVSCTVAVKLYERARHLFEDDRIAFKIARYAIENISFGYVQNIFVKAFWSTKTGLKNLQKINDKWNRNKRVELVELRGNEAIVRLHWNPGMDVSKDLCYMNQGSYIYLPRIWGAEPMDLRETCCHFEGAPYCEFHLKWPIRNRIYEVVSRFFTSKTVLKETLAEMEEGKRVLEEKYAEVNRLNVELNYKIKQLLAVQETGKAILSVLDLDQLLTVIMNILSTVCKIDRVIIMLVNQEQGCLEYLHCIGFEGDAPEAVKAYRVPLHRVSNILARVANTGRPEYIPKVENSKLRKDNIMLAHGRPFSVYVVPLITRSKVIGVIATDAADEKGIPRQTRETIEIFGPQIAIAIENARLYHRLREQMRELKKSHALLSRAEKFSLLGNLAARLAHEIKNPMTAIGTFLQMLPHKLDDEEFRRDFYKVALEETGRVNSLITELMDLVKTKKPQFHFDDLNRLIEKMIILTSPQTKAKKITFVRRFDADLDQVWIDSEKMKQVVLNLFSNAVECTPDGGRIEVSTRLVPDTKPKVIRIEIKDNGPGIPEDMLDRIFDPYFSTKPRSSIHNGTGLGLFIAHKNIEDHGGTIDVMSRIEEGTTFTVTLPVDPSSKLRHHAGHRVS